MNNTSFVYVLSTVFASAVLWAEPVTCLSPDARAVVTFDLTAVGEPTYSFAFRGETVIAPSRLGFDIKALGADAFDGRKAADLRRDFVLTDVKRATADETWKPVWGEEKEIRDHHNELLVALVQKTTGRRMNVRFRVFDEGLGFRYEFPSEEDKGVARLVPGQQLQRRGTVDKYVVVVVINELQGVL